MSKLNKVIIGISGGIAAYKIPLLIRLFQRQNIAVQVVATKNALNFVTPLTLEVLSQTKLYSDVFEQPEKYDTRHISITDDADAMIVAPATANVLAKFAHGIADDALTTTYLSFEKTVFIAPAMNTKMYQHPATVENINKLRSRGVYFIEPEEGFLACGTIGIGRMAEPEAIFQSVINFFASAQILKNKKVLVTAGPTYEPIDPVRYIGNHSSGKMGYAIAEAFIQAGATVKLITGPVHLTPPAGVAVEAVITADQMLQACLRQASEFDIIVMAAAVADYTPEIRSEHKLKKQQDILTVTLRPTVDILAELGKQKKHHQILIGFALETEHHLEYARKKLIEKKADCIILNPLEKDSGFGTDTNKITFVTQSTTLELPLMSKKDAAREIVNFIYEHFIQQKQ